jgi:hypothetical protein
MKTVSTLSASLQAAIECVIDAQSYRFKPLTLLVDKMDRASDDLDDAALAMLERFRAMPQHTLLREPLISEALAALQPTVAT